MPNARDPLQNETLRVPEPERIASSVPEAYQLVYQAWDGVYKLQGAFKTYNAQGMVEYEWRDIPTRIE